MEGFKLIYVDSNRQIIEMNSEYIALREKAEERTELYHFCKLSDLNNILKTKSLLLSNLNNFSGSGEYEKSGIDTNFLGCVFISSLTHCKNSKNLWNDFGDNGKGVKLTFSYSGIFHNEVFDQAEKVKAYSKDKTLLAEYGFSVSCVKAKQLVCLPNYSTDIIVDLILSDVIYSNSEPVSTVCLNNDKLLNLSNVSRTVLQHYNDEFETRMIGILRSTKEICIADISYLLVPLDFSKFELKLEFGNKVNTEVRTEYIRFLNNIRMT